MKFLLYFLLALSFVVTECSLYYILVAGRVRVPGWVLYLTLAYVLFQILRIQREGKFSVSDILYYLGGVALCLPEFSESDELWFEYRWIFAFIVSSIILKPLIDVTRSSKSKI